MNETAPKDYVWVCFACGKRSKDKYGSDPIDKGWDESCMLNSYMVAEADITITDHRVSEFDGDSYRTIEEINNA